MTSNAPTMFEATNSASSRWYCQFAVPVSVTTPSLDLRVDGARDEAVEHQRLQNVAAKVGVRPLVVVHQLYLSLLSTEMTPNTRSAAFFASRFSRRLPTVPRSVTVPSSAETAIAVVVDLGVPEELVGDVGHQLGVRRHCDSFRLTGETRRSSRLASSEASEHLRSRCGNDAVVRCSVHAPARQARRPLDGPAQGA